MSMNRRDWLRIVGAAGLSHAVGAARAAASNTEIGFGFRLYGMQSIKTSDALRTLAEIGYDGAELELRPGWGTQATELSPERRRELRKEFMDLGLELPAVNENLTLVTDEAGHKNNLERLKAGAGVFHDISSRRPALLETVLGSKSADWEKVKGQMADRLGEWAGVAKSSEMVIAFKGHAGQAADTPERVLWLLDQVKSPWMKIGFDYSHFEIIGISLADALRQLLPHAVLILAKEGSGSAKDFTRVLPGDGHVDYVDYFNRLKAANYRGDVVVEVSAQIHNAAGYQPVETARHCYANLAPAFAKAGIRRKPMKHAA